MGTSRSSDRLPARMGDLAGGMIGELARRRLARRNTTRKPSLSNTATPEEVRAKASATLWWVKGHPSVSSLTATAPMVCPKCKGAGWVRLPSGAETNWQVKTEPCSCFAELMAHERWERALAASDITPALLTLIPARYAIAYSVPSQIPQW